jgi:hypothetical protein
VSLKYSGRWGAEARLKPSSVRSEPRRPPSYVAGGRTSIHVRERDLDDVVSLW